MGTMTSRPAVVLWKHLSCIKPKGAATAFWAEQPAYTCDVHRGDAVFPKALAVFTYEDAASHFLRERKLDSTHESVELSFGDVAEFIQAHVHKHRLENFALDPDANGDVVSVLTFKPC